MLVCAFDLLFRDGIKKTWAVEGGWCLCEGQKGGEGDLLMFGSNGFDGARKRWCETVERRDGIWKVGFVGWITKGLNIIMSESKSWHAKLGN